MPEITEGSLYSGYGGLGMALRAASGLPVRTLWHCDSDPDCDATLAKHHPGAPNLGTDAADWAPVERPDVLTLGPPCQSVSGAGFGFGADDPRWRWPYAYTALAVLRPPVLFFENVDQLAAGTKMSLWLGILADMRAAGYQVAWIIIGACAVGAPHHRHRLFAVGRLRGNPGPAVRVGSKIFCDDSLPLLPTPTRGTYRRGHNSIDGRGDPDLAGIAALLGTDWKFGRYAPAVERWERLTGRPAPEPVEPTARGGEYRLASALPEWMMGLPEGHLTEHLARPAALRLAGNGVCPQQAAEAWRILRPLV